MRVEVVDKRGTYIFRGRSGQRPARDYVHDQILGSGSPKLLHSFSRTIGILWGCVNFDFDQVKAPHLHRQRPSKPNNSSMSGSCSRKLSVKSGRSHGNMQVHWKVTNISDT